jgi:hypothetical protein
MKRYGSTARCKVECKMCTLKTVLKDVIQCPDHGYRRPFFDIFNIKRDTVQCKIKCMVECKVCIFTSWLKMLYFNELITNLETLSRYLHY